MRIFAPMLCALLMLPVPLSAAWAAMPDVWLLEETGDDGNKAWCAFHDRAGFLAESQKVGSGIFGGLLFSGGILSEIDESAQINADYVLYQSYFVNADGTLARFERRSEMAKYHVIVVEDFVLRQGNWAVVETRFLDQDSGKPLDRPKDVRWPFGPVIHTVLRKFPFYPLIANPAIRIVDKVCAQATTP
jgi:hypothetical protein